MIPYFAVGAGVIIQLLWAWNNTVGIFITSPLTYNHIVFVIDVAIIVLAWDSVIG